MFVGESRPYPTSSYYGGGAYGGYSSIQQMKIGVTLEVTPLINPDGLVVMDIQQQIDSFAGNVTIVNVGEVPITATKQASAKVSVRDHDTIILGGLIDTEKDKNASGVPFLMDIPLLGYLFRTSHADNTRNELDRADSADGAAQPRRSRRWRRRRRRTRCRGCGGWRRKSGTTEMQRLMRDGQGRQAR